MDKKAGRRYEWEGLLWEGLMGSAQLHYIALWANTQKSGNVGVSNFSQF